MTSISHIKKYGAIFVYKVKSFIEIFYVDATYNDKIVLKLTAIT